MGNPAAATLRKTVRQRKRPIRGLWLRNDRYYAQLTVEEPETGRKRVRRVPLEGAATAPPRPNRSSNKCSLTDAGGK